MAGHVCMERGPGPQQLRVSKGRAESTSVRRGLSHHTALHFPWPPQEGRGEYSCWERSQTLRAPHLGWVADLGH